MLDALIKLALRHRFLVLALTALTTVYGALGISTLPVDVFPDLNRPTVNIISEAEGLAPEEIEAGVTRHIEAVINGTAGVTKVYSSSVTGLSVVRVEFTWGTELKDARLAVSERLQLAKERLPRRANVFLSPTSSIMGETQMIGVWSRNQETELSEVRSLVEWTIKPRLLTVPGVSQVTAIGENQNQIQILVDPEKMSQKQLSARSLLESVSNLSASSGGGYVIEQDREWLVRNIGRILDRREIGETPIGNHQGHPVLLKQVASVEFTPPPKRGDASVNGKPGIILMIEKQPTADTVTLTKSVDAALEDLNKTLPEDIILDGGLFKQSDFIDSAIKNVAEAIRDGTGIVAIILALFLLNLRTTLITLTAIPVSLLITGIAFHLMDIGINTMTLGGLAIAIGELVDDAIVDVENVFRRLKENRLSLSPLPPLTVVYAASREIRNSIVPATVIVILVFVPLFALPGLEGRLFNPIGAAYVISLAASLLVSITLTPVLCYFLLKDTRFKDHKDTFLVRGIKSIHRTVLGRTLRFPLSIIVVSIVLVGITASLIPRIGRDFLPPFNEGSAMAEMSLPSGTSLEASSAIALKAENALLTIPEVVSTGRRTGRAGDDKHAAGVNQSEWEIRLKPSDRSRAEVFADIREKIRSTIPETAFFSLSQPISHRLDHLLSGVKAQMAIKLCGPDLRQLRQIGAEVRNAIQGAPGVVDLQIEGQSLFPQYKIFPMRPDLAKYGIKPGRLIMYLEAMLQGTHAGRIIDGDRTSEIFLRLEQKFRSSLDDIRKLPVKTLPSGETIKLERVADIFETSGPNMIERENLQRRIAISFNALSPDLDSLVKGLKAKIKETIQLPAGYFLEFGGQYESQRRAINTVALLGILSIFAVFLVLVINFRSIAIALQIMLNLPLALIGSVTAIYLSGGTFSVATLIAFVTLCGITSRNGIMMISHYIHLMREEGEVFSREMVIRGSLERLVPVLMTALSAMLALLPLVQPVTGFAG